MRPTSVNGVLGRRLICVRCGERISIGSPISMILCVSGSSRAA